MRAAVAVIAMAAAQLASAGEFSNIARSPVLDVPIQKSPPSELVCYPAPGDSLGEPELAALASLQGALASKGCRTNLFHLANPADAEWLDTLSRDFGVGVRFGKFAGIMEEYGGEAGGYVEYGDPKTDFNAASMEAALRNALVFEKSRAEEFSRLSGLKRLPLPSETASRDYIANNSSSLDFSAAACQKPELKYPLRDYISFAKIPVFFAPKLPRAITKSAKGKSLPIFGYGDYESAGEDGFVKEYAKNGFYSLPTDHARNLSVLCAFRYPETPFRKPSAEAVRKRRARLVAFVMTDGDNLGFNLGDMRCGKRWGAAKRASDFPIAWGLSASLAEIAQPALKRWLDSPGGYTFFAASGQGYSYPSLMDADFREKYARDLSRLMKKSGLSIMQAIDFGAAGNAGVWRDFLKHPEISGVIYFEYAPYHGADGAVNFVENKPVIAAKASFWEGLTPRPPLAGSSEDDIARLVNSAPADLANPDSYIIIAVHVWSKSVGDVEKLAARFDENTLIVSPETLFKTASERLGGVRERRGHESAKYSQPANGLVK